MSDFEYFHDNRSAEYLHDDNMTERYIVTHTHTFTDLQFPCTRTRNPTGGVVLDFSFRHCLSGTHFWCVSFKLIIRTGIRDI